MLGIDSCDSMPELGLRDSEPGEETGILSPVRAHHLRPPG
jgi:hypothetical protein